MFSRIAVIVPVIFVSASSLQAQAALVSLQKQSPQDLVKDSPAESADAMHETIKLLDTDRSGKVEMSEIESFAQGAGLSLDEIRQDFAELDHNSDGALDADEITGVMALMDGAVNPAPLDAVETKPHNTEAAPEKEENREQHIIRQSESAPSPAWQANDVKLHRLGHEAENKAARTLAEAITRRAEELMQQGTKDAKVAAKYEALAQSLRANATAALRGAAVHTKSAAREASEQIVQSVISKVQHLQATAASMQKEAEDHWAKARVAMDRVLEQH